MIECFSGRDSEKNARLSFAILCMYPNQVAVAKASQELMRMESVAVSFDQLIDDRETDATRQMMNWLQGLPSRHATGYFEHQSREATAILSESAAIADGLKPCVRFLLREYPWREAIERAKRFEEPTDEDLAMMLEFAILPLAENIRPEFRFQRQRLIDENAKKYKLRWAAALWWLLWDKMVRLPRPEDHISSKLFVNDLLDLEYIVPSTCFDGYMSGDKRAFEIYRRTNGTIRGLMSLGKRSASTYVRSDRLPSPGL